MSMKKSSDTIGNRTRDLPACSIIPQPTAPPPAPEQDDSRAKVAAIFRLDGDKEWTVGSKYVNCGANIDRKHALIICMTRFKSVFINMAKMRNC
jgi:hypothetical protein